MLDSLIFKKDSTFDLPSALETALSLSFLSQVSWKWSVHILTSVPNRPWTHWRYSFLFHWNCSHQSLITLRLPNPTDQTQLSQVETLSSPAFYNTICSRYSTLLCSLLLWLWPRCLLDSRSQLSCSLPLPKLTGWSLAHTWLPCRGYPGEFNIWVYSQN